MGDEPQRYVISVLAPDHVGIIADVTEALHVLGANLEALSQTVVSEWFTMIARGAFPRATTAAAVREAIEAIPGVEAIVASAEEVRGIPVVAGEPYVVTAQGEDQPGIVCRFARCFAQRGVNIEDVWNEARQGQFIQIFHVTVPVSIDPGDLRQDLEAVAAGLGMTVRLQHQDIFTATTSLSVHTTRPVTEPAS